MGTAWAAVGKETRQREVVSNWKDLSDGDQQMNGRAFALEHPGGACMEVCWLRCFDDGQEKLTTSA